MDENKEVRILKPRTFLLSFGFILLPLLLLAACESKNENNNPSGEFRVDGTLEFLRPDGSVIRAIEIEIAENPSERQTGMMYRRQMTLGQGMLFVFPDEDMRKFWMANTPVPLDIIYVDADMKFVNIVKRTKPMSKENVLSTGPARYVVEVRGGFSDRYGLTDSTRIRWQRNS